MELKAYICAINKEIKVVKLEIGVNEMDRYIDGLR
jgi:hypothetical protein